ncbi:sulfate ABC transporter substrate-binding protein [Nonomuraea sp. NPDC050786]|uniref:sulfate ABC transporter substrate-binding protein n=1 Tax=Nonomuraea sp. NPDC050786 TaxID=3154840 RepID=UPI003403F86D
MNVRRLMATATVMASIATLAACGGGGSDGGSGGQVQLSLVAYSTPQAAYEKIIQAFQATPEGKNVTFTKSFGASGDQSRAVEAGLKADIVAFSLEPDMTRLVKKGLVAEDWSTGEHKGMITDSVVVIATRKGNPKNLKTWDDLIKPGVEVITPNPFTSGGARWNVMAGYGAKSNKGADKQAGVGYLNSLFAKVPVQDDSARKSLQTFSSGKGDAILAYENEAIFAQQNNQPLDYTVPDSTILIENPVAVTKNSAHPNEAKAFLKFLYTTEAQKIFADNGYRPVVKGVQGVSFPAPPALFTIADLGGWSKVTTEFFDPKGSVMADVERKLGVSIEK